MRARDLRHRIVTLFVVGVALPSGLLGYLALRGVRNDQALFERQQREELQEAARQVLASFHARLSNLDTRASNLAGTGEPLIDVVFGLTPDGRFDGLESAGVLYRPADSFAPDVALPAGDEVRLDVARRRELRDEDLDAAAVEYARLLSEGKSARGRAEARNGLARVSRKQGRVEAAAEGYRRLIAEYGAIRSGAGVPFALAGRLELVALLAATADAEAAAVEATALLEALLAVEHELSATEYGLLADQTRDLADRLVGRMREAAPTAPSADALAELLAREEGARARTGRINRFVTAVGEQPDLLRPLADDTRDAGARGAMIQAAGGPHAAYLLARDDDRSDAEAFRGFLLGPRVPAQLAEEIVREVADARSFRWTLRDESGGAQAGSPGAAEENPAVVVEFPGRFPPLSLGLLPPATGVLESFFTSPRSLYLYAFILVVGILAGGLALTVRTLSHQLELARMQSDFVSTVSHELKSPLTAIRQISEMLQAGRVPSEARQKRYFDVLVEQSQRLTTFIDRVLDFARLDAGRATLNLVEVDLQAFIDDVVSGIQERVRHQGFAVHSELDLDLPSVRLDPDAMALATTNLIDNGIKFSGDAREVIVRASAHNGDAVIAVRDFGIGLAPAERERVFERFYRGGDALTRSVKGTGLGLTLVRQIVEAHGGSVAVDSELGRGSTFTMRLPVTGP